MHRKLVTPATIRSPTNAPNWTIRSGKSLFSFINSSKVCVGVTLWRMDRFFSKRERTTFMAGKRAPPITILRMVDWSSTKLLNYYPFFFLFLRWNKPSFRNSWESLAIESIFCSNLLSLIPSNMTSISKRKIVIETKINKGFIKISIYHSRLQFVLTWLYHLLKDKINPNYKMLNVPFSLLIALYLIPSLIIIVFFWVRSEARKKEKVLPESSQFSYCCPICAFVYIDTSKGKYSRCPRCNSLNEKKEMHSSEKGPNQLS